MSQHKCELCGTPVKVVGKTTKHYEPLGSMASVPSVAIDIALKAKKVMDLLEKHGSGIVPHLLDTDENAGQELRDAIHDLLTDGKGVNQKQILELILQYHEFSGIPFPRDESPLEFVKQFKKWEAKEPQWPLESKAPVRETGDHRAYWYNLGRADAIKAWKDAQKGLV